MGAQAAGGAGRRIWRLAGFPIRMVAVYLVLMAPWPGLSEAYGRLYAGAAAALFDDADPQQRVMIRHAPPEPATKAALWRQDTMVGLTIRGDRVGGRDVPPFVTLRSSHYTGYTSAALAVALVVALPLPWRRRLTALPLALVATSAFSLLMIGLFVHGWFHVQACLALAEGSPFWSGWARLVGSLLTISAGFGPYYVAPVAIVALVSFRRGDLEGMADTLSSGGSKP